MMRLIKSTLVCMLSDAEHDGLIRNNVAKNAIRKRGSRQKAATSEDKKVRPFEENEVARLLATAHGEERALILFLVRTGCRPGEAFGLQWADIDFIRREALIERSISSGKLGKTKTGKSRKVDLSLELITALRDLRVQRQRQTLKHGWGEVPESVFINGVGRALDISRVRKDFAKTMKSAGIGGGHVLYDLRHTRASSLLAKDHRSPSSQTNSVTGSQP